MKRQLEGRLRARFAVGCAPLPQATVDAVASLLVSFLRVRGGRLIDPGNRGGNWR